MTLLQVLLQVLLGMLAPPSGRLCRLPSELCLPHQAFCLS